MIIRTVKMKFRTEEVARFLQFFNQRKSQIRGFDGCLHLELWQDISDPDTLWTYSHWLDEESLENYRRSPFFKDTWTQTKQLFASRAEAWSLRSVVTVKAPDEADIADIADEAVETDQADQADKSRNDSADPTPRRHP